MMSIRGPAWECEMPFLVLRYLIVCLIVQAIDGSHLFKLAKAKLSIEVHTLKQVRTKLNQLAA
jgi:hypothetical protein